MTQESQTLICQFVEDFHKTEKSKTRLIQKRKKKGGGGEENRQTLL